MSVSHEKGSFGSKEDVRSVTGQELRHRTVTEHGAQIVEDTKGDQTLHRGLKARQISMIAVSSLRFHRACDTQVLVSS